MEVSVRIRTIISVLAVVAALMVATPAFAQEKGAANVAFGYSNLTILDDVANTNIPTGWLGAIGFGLSSNAAFVGEVGGHYKDGVKMHTFQGGVKMASTKNPKTSPFFQVLTGLGHASAAGVSANAWTLTPGGGVDVKINEKASFRAQGDWAFSRSEGVNQNGLRFSGLVVFNVK
jgi:hypothetical protein